MNALRVEHSDRGHGMTDDWLYDGDRDVGHVSAYPASQRVLVTVDARHFAAPDYTAGIRLLRQLDAVAQAGGDLAAAITALGEMEAPDDDA